MTIDYKTITGYIHAPTTALTRGYAPTVRRDYRDGIAAVTYWRKGHDEREPDYVSRHLVWQYDRGGWKAGFLWSDTPRIGDAVRQFRNGKRAGHSSITVMDRP